MYTKAHTGAPWRGVAPMHGSVHRESKRIAHSLMSEEGEGCIGEVGVLLPSTPCIATTVASACLTLESSAFIQIFGQDTRCSSSS